MESVEFGEVSAGVAARITELARSRQFRRLFACTPASVIDHVRAHLTLEQAADLDAALAGLTLLPPVAARPALTPAERRVLDALGGHPSTAAVAEALGVSPNTVKTQLKSVFKKLGVNSRDEAVAVATQFSLFVGTPEESVVN